MKSILDIYEGVLDSDTDVMVKTQRAAVTKEMITNALESSIPSLKDTVKYNMEILEDGKIKVERFSYNIHDVLPIIGDLPDYIQFENFPDSKVEIVVHGDKVTSLHGLPENLSYFNVSVENCPNLKDFGDIKTVKTLILENVDLSKIKKLPKALKYIRCVNCTGDFDEKKISKISDTPKNKVTIL